MHQWSLSSLVQHLTSDWKDSHCLSNGPKRINFGEIWIKRQVGFLLPPEFYEKKRKIVWSQNAKKNIKFANSCLWLQKVTLLIKIGTIWIIFYEWKFFIFNKIFNKDHNMWCNIAQLIQQITFTENISTWCCLSSSLSTNRINAGKQAL